MPTSTAARLARRCLAAALAGACAAALAAPADADDPMAALIADRGLAAQPSAPPAAPAAETGFVGRVRGKASGMIVSAMAFLGVPYRRGGNGDAGFDCCGFTRHIFESSLGLVLPRKADEQAHAPGLTSVRRDELEPGDLVFFNTLRRTFSHVGIYIGDGKFIHSPRAGGRVRLEDMRQSYWTKRFTGARRAEPLRTVPAAAPAAATEPVAPDAADPTEAARQRY